MTQLNIGGVPEYFNLPIYDALENGLFSDEGIDLKWTDVSQGTGAMANMLDTGALDLAIILTEGITKSIIDGNKSKIIKNYVDSPLTWGVHTPPNDQIMELDEVKHKRIAISRYGSGSHLMSFLLAKRIGWQQEDIEFHIVNNLEGAQQSFLKNETNIFLWEKYTTQPYVDNGAFLRTDTIKTPWPCFVIAANNGALMDKIEAIKTTCTIINKSCLAFQNNSQLSAIIKKRFSLNEADTISIVKELKWSDQSSINQPAIEHVIDTLYELNLINEKVDPSVVTFEG